MVLIVVSSKHFKFGPFGSKIVLASLLLYLLVVFLLNLVTILINLSLLLFSLLNESVDERLFIDFLSFKAFSSSSSLFSLIIFSSFLAFTFISNGLLLKVVNLEFPLFCNKMGLDKS